MTRLPTMQYILMLALAVTPELSIAARLKPQQMLFANTSDASGDSALLGIHAGRVLNNRFRLESLMESRATPPFFIGQPMMWGPSTFHQRPMVVHRPQMHGGGMVQQQAKVPSEQPGVSFPQGTEFSSEPSKHAMKHLGNGQFGDVWEAIDLETGEKVAVKVFYRHTPGGGKAYLTWNTADQPNREEMKKNIKECELVQQIIRQGATVYPVGANRVCECKSEFIKQGMEHKDNVMYTVWEMCGQSMTKLRTEMATFSAADRQKAARLLTKQVIEAVHLLSMFQPALIHHDMKADNAVVLGSLKEGYKVKLIDFGCFVRASPQNKYSQSIGDPDYMPPEHSVQSNAFDDPPSSFDIYGIGLIHMELLCPALKNTDWSPVQAMRANPMMMMGGQKPTLSMNTVKSMLKQKCGELFSGGNDISDDLDLIEKLTSRWAGGRLLPAAALEHPAMDKDDVTVGLEFKIGDKVEYYSSTNGGWVPCVVANVNTEFGYYNLGNCVTLSGIIPEHRKLFHPDSVRAVQSSESPLSVAESFQVPLVAMVFKVGENVEYHSMSTGQWLRCVVAKVSHDEAGLGTYELNLPDGTGRRGVPPERVREASFAPGTKVIVYGNLPGIVVSYDGASGTYRVQAEGRSDTFYTNVSRDFIVAMEAAFM